MEQSFEQQTSIKLVNCQIKRVSSTSDDVQFEVVVASTTSVENSTKQYKVTTEDYEDNTVTKDVKLEDIHDISVNQRITLKIKVISVKDPEKITSKAGILYTKQECIIADSSGNCRCVLWEQNVQRMEDQKCYVITDCLVRSFDNVKYVSAGEHTIIDVISDIGDVADIQIDVGETRLTTIEGEVIGVTSMEYYRCCIMCKSKLSEITADVWKCMKCNGIFKSDKCPEEVCAKIIIQSDINYHYHVTAFKRVIDNVVANDSSDKPVIEKLLSTKRCNFVIDKNNVLINIQ
jgi:ribosomal protein L37AE/L43A